MRHKISLITQLIKTCAKYDTAHPQEGIDGEQDTFFDYCIMPKVLKKLSNKELEKLITYTKNKI
tara:strand:+ start:70 stop:261 length:192 start_codon:yes stop_codon:yes gene_type:complete